MKNCVLYPIDKILECLPGHRLVEIEVDQYTEDEGHWKTTEKRLTNQSKIIKFSSSYGFGRWDTCIFETIDGIQKKAESVSYSDDATNPDRIKTRDIISPKLVVVEDSYVEKERYLVEWLEYKGVNIEELDKYAKEITLYATIEYPGVPDVVYHERKNGTCYFGYSSNNLILDEREIEEVLNGIDDKLLREKIKCVLEARVFKKRY